MTGSGLDLRREHVDIWYATPDESGVIPGLERYQGLLSADERQRHQAFHFDRDRHLYLVAHALLRTSLLISSLSSSRPLA